MLTGAYIGYLPEHYARYWVDRGEMRRIGPADTAFDIEFCIVTRRGAIPSRAAASFIESLDTFHRKPADTVGRRAPAGRR
ncbi:MAG: substrate-binding domain-containing protein [Gammaproteobacteria bacterium]|nr:substrate-binding domain-containing protein [Gammaproteobacteria bacterium]